METSSRIAAPGNTLGRRGGPWHPYICRLSNAPPTMPWHAWQSPGYRRNSTGQSNLFPDGAKPHRASSRPSSRLVSPNWRL